MSLADCDEICQHGRSTSVISVTVILVVDDRPI